ncbi:MAG: GMC family oxidoreductase [Verrucomicrobiota bacterium]
MIKASTPGEKQIADTTTESVSADGKVEISRRHFIQKVALAAGSAALAPEVARSAETAGSQIGSKNYDYDVVIIGSGISGAIVAKRVAEMSPKATILILEAGAGGLNDRSREVSNYFSNLAKFPEAPFDENINAPSATIKDLIGASPSYLDHVDETAKTTHFGSTYVRKTGGTMWHWMGTCLRFMPKDFKTFTEYGRGQDWPISYDDLAITTHRTLDGREVSYYDMAEDEIGVSAHVEEQDPPINGVKLGLFRAGREYPMPALKPTIVDEFFKKGVAGMTFEGNRVWVYKTPAGRKSVPYMNRPACAGNSSCVPICRIKAKYDATVTLDHVIRTYGRRVTLRSQCIVTELLHDATTKEITGVQYIPYSDPARISPQTPKTVTGRTYVLAANGIESPKLMLASGMGAINDTIGRNLMDHPFFLRQGLAPQGSKTYPYRGPLSTGGLDGLRDGNFRAKRAAYRIEIGNDGWALSGEDPWKTVSKFVDRNWYGERLVKHLNDLFTRQCRIGFELEQLPDRDNRVTLSEHKDAFGLYRPKVRYSYSDYEKAGFHSALKFTRKLFQRLEIEDTSLDRDDPKTDFMAPNVVMGAGHVMGTCCMGHKAETSVVDREQRSHDFKNLFVVGSSVFTTGGTANPTLTIAALAFWAGDTISKELG